MAKDQAERLVNRPKKTAWPARHGLGKRNGARASNGANSSAQTSRLGALSSLVRTKKMFSDPNIKQPVESVGWVERSDTHHARGERMGFAALYPSYDSWRERARRYCDRYALVAVPLATDIDGAPGAIVQLDVLRVKVESTMDRPVEVRLDVELAVSFRLGR